MRFAHVLAPALLVTLIAIPQSAKAQRLVDGDSFETIIAIARGYGTATLASQKSGDPKISGSISGMGYAIYFTSCTQSRECAELNFYAGFLDIKPTLDAINSWNATKRFGRAYLDADGDASIEMDVNVKEGLSRDNLAHSFELWRIVLSQYAQYTGFQ